MTIQQSEVIEIENLNFELAGNCQPLKPFLEQNRIYVPTANQISCNWRGYVGFWKIEDSHLLLSEVVDLDTRSIKKGLGFTNSSLKAEWFSGDLVFDSGEIIDHSNSLGNTYRFTTKIRIKEGEVHHFSTRDRRHSVSVESNQIPMFVLECIRD